MIFLNIIKRTCNGEFQVYGLVSRDSLSTNHKLPIPTKENQKVREGRGRSGGSNCLRLERRNGFQLLKTGKTDREQEYCACSVLTPRGKKYCLVFQHLRTKAGDTGKLPSIFRWIDSGFPDNPRATLKSWIKQSIVEASKSSIS